MNNLSTSNIYHRVDNSTLISDEENKIEPHDDDDINDNRNDLTTTRTSTELIDFNTGPLNPNCVTTVTNTNSLNDDSCIKNYQEIGSIVKPSARERQIQRQQKQHRKQQQYHQRNLQRDQKQQQQHYLSQPTTSFSQQMYKTASDVGGSPFSSSYNNNNNSMPPYSSQSNYSNSQTYQQQPNYQSNQNYSNMINPINALQQQQQYEPPPHRYYQEPIFRPPPTSAYYQNYFAPPSRQTFDYASIYGHPPRSFGPSGNPMYWYPQQHHHQSNYGPPPHFSQVPPHSTIAHSHQLHHPQHSQYLAQTVGGNMGPTFGNPQHNEQMMNVLQFSNSNGREARNRAEKQRRDKLNGSIADLATMVPHVAESPRRVDKTAVLRYSAHGLRLRYVYGKTLESCDEESGTGLLLTDSITKLLDGFLLTVTCRGQIVLITPSVEQHLGHCQTDLFGQNILHITHPDDHQMLKQQLIPTDLDQLFDTQEDESGEPRPRTQEEENEIDRRLLADKRNFTVRLARATPRSEPAAYEIVKIDGCFRRADSAPRGVKSSTFPSGLQLIRRARGRDDSIPLPSISANDIVLVAMVRIIKPPKIIDRLREANNFEYKTRHLIDGRMIMVDQRISLVAGYMTDEVTGLSPFTFMHQDDVRWVIVALRQMYDSNSSYGESCYRLLTRTGRFIYLRTRGYLEIDKNTNQVHSFLCINSLVSEEEGRQRCQEMKNKFSIIINANIPPSNTDGLAVDNPQQLEKAVIYLIENLQKTAREVVEADDDEYCNERGRSNDNPLDCKASIHGCDGNESPKNTERLTKSPPLTLVPPNTSSIKSSISKSVTVVNTTAAKSFRISRARSKCLSEKSNIKDDMSSVGEDSNSSNSSSNLNLFANDIAVKQEDQNDKTSFQFNKFNHNCGNKNFNNNENISNLNNNSSNNTNKNHNENESNYEKQRKQQNSDINNILIKTENIEYFSDNENINENNDRVPPLPKSSGYYEIEIINDPTDNIIMTSRTEFKVMQSPSTSLLKYDELNRSREQQKHADLKRSRNTYEDITLDSCDSPSGKRMALSDSPLGIENISTSSLDNDQMFANTSTTMQRTCNPQEDLSQLLPSSFSQIKNSLSHIKTATTELKRQCIAYADTQNQLEEIIDERDKQEELLENIQSEYEAHLLEHQGLATSPITTSDGSVSLPLSNVLKSSDVKSSTTATKTTTVIDFDTDDILQRNINLTNTR